MRDYHTDTFSVVTTTDDKWCALCCSLYCPQKVLHAEAMLVQVRPVRGDHKADQREI